MQKSHLIAICTLLVAIVLVSILAFSILPKLNNGDNLHISFQQFLPGITGNKIIQTSDGGYLALGTTADISDSDSTEPEFVNEQPILVKTDSRGNVQWQKTFQVLGLTPALCNIAQTKEGGYVVVGGITDASNYTNPFSRFCLIKLDASGEVNWTQTYAGASTAKNDVFIKVLQTSEGGYTLFGTWLRYWDYHGLTQGYLVKTDEAGNAYFSESIDTVPSKSIIQVSDGYIFFTSRQGLGGGGSLMLVKTDFNGTEIWSKTYLKKGASSAYGTFGLATTDGGYLLSGHLTGDLAQGWLVKTDVEGKMLWNRTYPNVVDINSIAQEEDGGYLICGATNATKSSYDGTAYTAWFAKIDSVGNIEAELNAGPVELRHSTTPNSIIQTNDGEFMCVGTWDSTYQASSTQRFWIAKISL